MMRCRIKGSTLVEALIAMLIVLSVSAVAVTMLIKITETGSIYHQTRAEVLAGNILNQYRSKSHIQDTLFKEGNYNIMVKTTKESGSRLCRVDISVSRVRGEEILLKSIYIRNDDQ